jgi:predicted SprT family Zn-dependent metalloprotease
LPVLSPQAIALERDRALAVVGRVLGIPTWPEVPLSWNRRLRRAGRAVFESRGRGPLQVGIELSPAYFEVYPSDLHGILIHEAVHVGLALQRRPYGHGPAFRRACKKAGGLLHSRHLPGRVFRYRCPVCEQVLERRRRPSGDRWCASCARDAERLGEPPFTRTRALVLVDLVYVAPYGKAADASPVAAPDRPAPVGPIAAAADVR